MASSSKNRSSLHPPRHRPAEDDAWKTAPSRETTHDDPAGKDRRVEQKRKPLENAPGKADPDDDA